MFLKSHGTDSLGKTPGQTLHLRCFISGRDAGHLGDDSSKSWGANDLGDFCFRDQRAKSDAKNTYSKAHHFQYCVFNFHGACIYIIYLYSLYISCMQIHILSLDMGNNIHRLYTGFPGGQKPQEQLHPAKIWEKPSQRPTKSWYLCWKSHIYIYVCIIYIYNIHIYNDYFKKKESSGVLFAVLGGGYFNLYIRYLFWTGTETLQFSNWQKNPRGFGGRGFIG